MKKTREKDKIFGDVLFMDKRPLTNSSGRYYTKKIQKSKYEKMPLFQHIRTKISLRLRLQAHHLKRHLLIAVCHIKA